jgi:hypothetical protein
VRQQILVYDTVPHVTHLVGSLHTTCTARNPTNREQPLPSVDNIAFLAEFSSYYEDAIMMALDKVACLNKMSLEGDIPDNVSDSGEAHETALFTEN